MSGIDLVEARDAGQRALRRARAVGRLGFARADRVTTGLAVTAAATAGSVLVGEVLRLARRRLGRRGGDPGNGAPDSSGQASGVLDSAGQAIGAASRAGRDTIAVAFEGYETAGRRERVLFNMLAGFVGSSVLVRLSTHGMRDGWWPLGSVRVSGRHIHHFVPGILLAFGCGAAAIATESRPAEQALALPFGAGVGLTFDEAALLLDLRDVYWTREGILSVQVSLGMAALLGGTILAMRMLRRGERQIEAKGLIPATGEGSAAMPWADRAPLNR